MKNKFSLFFCLFIGVLIFCGFSVLGYQADKDISLDSGIFNGAFDKAVNAVEIQSDGKIVVGGDFTSYDTTAINRIARLNSDGSLDTSFVVGSGFNNSIRALAIQSDGKIIVGGSFTGYNDIAVNRIARLNSDGSFDTSFNQYGTGTNGEIYAIGIQNDGKIVLGGYFTIYNGDLNNNFIVRLNPDGTKDNSFNIGGGLTSYPWTIGIQNDGKIVVGGSFNNYSGASSNYIIRLNSDGTRDTSFNIGGGFNNTVRCLKIQSDGKIVVGGNFTTYSGSAGNRIVRLTSTGIKDTSFVIGGGLNGAPYALAVQSDGKIIAGGNFSTYNSVAANRIVRLNTNGSRDTTFVIGNGFNANATIYTLGFQNNNIFVGGTFSSYNGLVATNIISINSSGSRNSSFGTLVGGFDNSVYSLVSQSDGKTLVAGLFSTYSGIINNNIARLNPDGSKDTSFSVGPGLNNTVSGYSPVLALQSDGKVIVGGYFSTYSGSTNNNIVRLTSTGIKDTSFTIGGGFNSFVNSLAIQSDGKIIAGGNFTTYSGSANNYIIRLNPDGTKDTSFSIGGGFNTYPGSIVLQSDGKIVVGGYFTSYSGSANNYIVRLNPDGTKDESFSIGNGFNGTIYSLIIQPDGKIVVGGNFTSYNGSVNNYIVRLNPDGTKDTSFSIGNGFNGAVRILTIQADGKILAGGLFKTYNGSSNNYIVRLNPDGTKDESFSIGGGFNNQVYAISLQNNGKIIVGGSFTFYNGISSPFLLALKGLAPAILPNSSDIPAIQDVLTYRGYTTISITGHEFSGSAALSLEQTDGTIPVSLNLINQNNKLSLPQNIQFTKSDSSNYTGQILPPTPVMVSTVHTAPVLTAIKVGSISESITLEGGVATLNMPVTKAFPGDVVNIYSSQNGIDWTFEKEDVVTEIGGQPSVSFTTNHFTYFAIAGTTGSFVIDNDNLSTTSQNVTLTVSAPGSQQMRFANSTGELTTAPWISYSTTYPWTLSDSSGSKTVYAEFDTDGDSNPDASTFDVIEFLDNGIKGNISLQITTGVSECIYATSLNLGIQDLKIGSAYDFSGSFAGQWYCSDFKGVSSGWAFTIQTSDLTNANNNIISGSNLLISHQGISTQGTSACTGFNGTPSPFYAAPLTLIEKINNNDQICKVTLSTIGLTINVPANQAPGEYKGILTLDIPAALY